MKVSILAIGILATVVALAGAASAEPTVSLIWTSTTGTGLPGGSSIDADVGDQLILKIFVSNSVPAEGISFAGISLQNTTGLTGTAAVECPGIGSDPSGNNLFSGTCTPTGFVLPHLSPFAPGVVISSTTMESFDAGTGQGFTTGTVELGAARYIVGATGLQEVSVFYLFNINGVTDGAGFVYFPTASASVNLVPGPGMPDLSATKSDTLLSDENGDGEVDPGDTLRYTVTIANDGEADAQNVVFSDTPDGNAPLVDGTVTTTQGTVTLGNSGGDTNVEVAIGTLPTGGDVTLTFDVAVVDPLPEAVATVSNQGLVTATDLADVPTDDPDTPAAGDATLTDVVTALETCQQDVASCDSDLGTCESNFGTCTSDLGTCEGDLGTAQAGLTACLNDPPFEDADADGEHDDTDACATTPAGEAVDASGCSLAEFCMGFDVSGSNRNSPCNQADWQNDEPLGAEDCKARGGICEPR